MMLNRNQERILLVLQDQPDKKFSTKELQDKLKIRYPTLAGCLAKLVEFQCISKHQTGAQTNGFTYSYLRPRPSDDYLVTLRKQINSADREIRRLKREGSTSKDGPVGQIQKSTELFPNDIEQLLRKFATERWHPKIIDSARNLPLATSRLYEIAAEVAYGGIVDQSIIQDEVLNLKKFRKDLIAVIQIVNGYLELLAHKSPNDLFLLLADTKDIEELKALALKVKELN